MAKAPKQRTVTVQDEIKDKETGKRGVHYSNRNIIAVTQVKGQEADINKDKVTVVHEQRHADNLRAVDKYGTPMSLEQSYKLKCYDEISANIAQILELRDQYRKAKTAEEKEKIKSYRPEFAFYFEAIEKGWINPFSTKPADIENEMRFIAQKTQSAWMEKKAKIYDKAHTEAVLSMLDYRSIKNLMPNDKNYKEARSKYMTLCGIDFSKYVKDIDCINPTIKQADKDIALQIPKSIVKEMIYSNATTPKVTLPENINYNFKDPKICYQKAREQMFIENAIKDYYKTSVVKPISNKDLPNVLKKYAQKIKTDPKLKAGWEKTDKLLASVISEKHLNLTANIQGNYKLNISSLDTSNIDLKKVCPELDKIVPPCDFKCKTFRDKVKDMGNHYGYQDKKVVSYQGKPKPLKNKNYSDPYEFTITDQRGTSVSDEIVAGLFATAPQNFAQKDNANVATESVPDAMRAARKSADRKITTAKLQNKAKKKTTTAKNQPTTTKKTKQTTPTPAQIAAQKKEQHR